MGRRYEHPIIDTKLRTVIDGLMASGKYRFYTQIAQAAGITPSRLSEYSLGRKSIPIHHLLRLCEALNCAPADIMGEETAKGNIKDPVRTY